MSLRLFVSAGEASGDRHAAGLVRGLRRRVGDLEVRGLGGDRLRAEGVDLLAHVEDLSVLGFAEVIQRLPYFLRLWKRVVREIQTWRPHLVLPVDYPGFNLRLGTRARSRGIPVAYYIAPQVWAWRRDRRPGIARAVDRLLVVFPFEEALFREAGIDAVFVGHPLLDELAAGEDRETARSQMGVSPEARLLALLPGSRAQEVRQILPVLARAAESLQARGVVSVVSRAPGLDDALFRPARKAGVSLWTGSAATLARAADAALVASGTATLETGLQGTPLAVVYRTGLANWMLARALVGVRRVGLVNIAAGGERVPELLQGGFTPEAAARTAERLLFDEAERREQAAYLATLRERLGGGGAVERAVEAVLDLLPGESA